jgi:hypothetical protein
LKDGSITDIGLGYRYSEKISGGLRFRSTMISKNEELQDVSDSLNAVNERIYEFYLMPVEYYIFKTPETRFWVGGGLYYQYLTLNEKGFFKMPTLETFTPPKERVKSYTNECNMHLLGPLFEFGISYSLKWFNISFSGGINPIFFLNSSQKMNIEPLLSHPAKYSQNTWGSPYFYFGLDSIILKYFNIVLLYDFARLKYKTVDFDSSLNWINPERKVTTQSFNIEASFLIPIKEIRVQIGYGYALVSTQLDNSSSINGNRHYIILAVKRNTF